MVRILKGEGVGVEDVKYTDGDGLTTDLIGNHPAFGAISITKIRSLGKKLVETTGKIDDVIELTITTSEQFIRNNGQTDIFEGSKIITILLSKSQFVDLFTTMNGESIPCTLDWVLGESKPNIGNNYKVGFDVIVDETLASYEKQLEDQKLDNEEFELILNKPKIGVKDKQRLKQLHIDRSELLLANINHSIRNIGKLSAQLVTKISTDIYDTVKTKMGLYKKDKKKLLGYDDE